MTERTKAAQLKALFGGNAALAEAIGVTPAVTSRWDSNDPVRGNYGNIPRQYNHAIMDGGRSAGLTEGTLARVQELLDQDKCPMCGSDLEPGQTLNKIK